MSKVESLIRALGLQPHPEGGHFRETFRDIAAESGLARSTAIYFLLRRGERSRWHRIEDVEIWHWYAGAPLSLCVVEKGGEMERKILGTNLDNGEQPQIVVPARAWQQARSLGDYTLAGCTVAPGFEFSRLEIAAHGQFPES